MTMQAVLEVKNSMESLRMGGPFLGDLFHGDELLDRYVLDDLIDDRNNHFIYYVTLIRTGPSARDLLFGVRRFHKANHTKENYYKNYDVVSISIDQNHVLALHDSFQPRGTRAMEPLKTSSEFWRPCTTPPIPINPRL